MVAGLKFDIVREATAADWFLRLGRLSRRRQNARVRHQIAVCAATALSYAAALAAEVIALGGAPPASPLPASAKTRPSGSRRDQISHARAELAHYQGRLVMARRLGLLRLQEVYRDIVRSKRRHLAHAGVISSACCMGRSTNSNRESFHANCGTHKRRHEHF
jgi:hypothetical protein